MTVHILTHSEDEPAVDRVVEEIRERGGRAVRFDTDLFPLRTRMHVEQTASGDRFHLLTDGEELDLSTVRAVWHRRIAIGRSIPREMDPQLRTASVDESRAVVFGTIAALDCFHLDQVDRIRFAGHKAMQLSLARECGLEIPKTLTTNDPEAVRLFHKTCPNGMVAKMLHSFAVKEDGEESVVFTTEMTEEHLADLGGLEFCPMTFQEKIEKDIELRVTVVGRQLFAAAVPSQEVSGAEVDWRRKGDVARDLWKAHLLPETLEIRIHEFMDRLGLNYGAIDLIRTPDGRYVFLEVNPAGEFSWLTVWPGFPLAEAFADTLLGRVERRDPRRVGALLPA